MRAVFRKAIRTVSDCALILILSGTVARAAEAEGSPKVAEEVFKNIQVLKGMPAGQMGPTMEFFRTALGIGCGGCHVSEEYPLEDRPNKQLARRMILMTLDINKNLFDGRVVVTCYTCHRGNPKPVGMFPVIASPPKANPAEAKQVDGKQQGNMPGVDQLLDQYITALGGAEAIRKISNRFEKGAVSDAQGRKFPMESWAKLPTKRITVLHLGGGDVFTLSEGDVGWNRTPGEVEGGTQAHDARREDLDQEKLEDPVWLAGRVKQILSDLRVERTEEVEGHHVYVVSGRKIGPDGAVAVVTLYFDQTSGLLTRLTYTGQSFFGAVPIFQYDYADYRTVNGVKLPFKWTVNMARVGAAQHFDYQVDEVRQNVPIEDSQFVVPPTVECIPPRCSGPTAIGGSGSSKTPSAGKN
jgi:photosynthetic reaction center cytochrome c subunit